MPKRIDVETRLEVIKLRQNGQSWAEIAKTLHLKSRYSARTIYTRWEKNGTVELKKSSGRPKKTSEKDEKQLVSIVQKDRFATLKKIRCFYNAFHPCHSLSVRSVRKILRKHGFRSRHAAKKLIIGPKTNQKRLKFCRKGIALGLDYWKTVAFTDEVRFSVQTDGLVRVWRRAGYYFIATIVIIGVSLVYNTIIMMIFFYDYQELLPRLPCRGPKVSDNSLDPELNENNSDNGRIGGTIQSAFQTKINTESSPKKEKSNKSAPEGENSMERAIRELTATMNTPDTDADSAEVRRRKCFMYDHIFGTFILVIVIIIHIVFFVRYI